MLPPTLSTLTVQKKPVAIPRLDVNCLLESPLPFLRAYSPVLRQHSVHEQDFVAFIGGLNMTQTAPVVLQAMDVVGTGIGFVWAARVNASGCLANSTGRGIGHWRLGLASMLLLLQAPRSSRKSAREGTWRRSIETTWRQGAWKFPCSKMMNLLP
jgi:hypothetical protein